MRMYRRYLFTRGSLSSIGEQPAGDGDGDGESECAATRKNKVRKLEGPKARVRGYINPVISILFVETTTSPNFICACHGKKICIGKCK